jgi:hypothetical protein
MLWRTPAWPAVRSGIQRSLKLSVWTPGKFRIGTGPPPGAIRRRASPSRSTRHPIGLDWRRDVRTRHFAVRADHEIGTGRVDSAA